MKKFFAEFKKFITRGNVVDMAVGVIVGSSFTAIVNGLSNFILKPLVNALLAIIFGKKISKAQQLTNWENSYLTAEQARYASTDAWATLLIYLTLQQTKPLTKKQVEALKLAEKEAQFQRQQQALARKAQQMANE
jgi:large conductance mechanosensitive channel protein